MARPMDDDRKILIVEDDAAIARLMQMHIEAVGHAARCCADGNKAIELLQEEPWKLVVLDRMLPGADGMRVLRFIRRTSREEMIPVLMVTALGQTAERVQGLNEGADDYLAKPFEPEELVARVQALLRRSTPVENERLSAGGIEVNPDAYEIVIQGCSITLRPLEYRLLQLLMKKPGKTRSRDYLLDHVWGRDNFVEPRTVDVTVKRLRKALKKCGVGDSVETIRGMGYRFNPAGNKKTLA
ncbi:MAG: response regulator transcription factor [Mariprofundaceae bacterium]|nr:response regulator transcription factor [Mariprofundaceae bacterium]